MGSQITLTMSIIFIVLFSVAIIGFATGFASDNDAVMSISDDAEISGFNTDTKTNLETAKDDSEGTYSSILETTVEPGSDIAQSAGPFAITIRNLVSSIKNIVTLPYKKIFGGGASFGIFFTTIGTVIAILFGLYLYKSLRGNP